MIPVSNFLIYLAQNCIKHSLSHPNDFQNSFFGTFPYIVKKINLVHFYTLRHVVWSLSVGFCLLWVRTNWFSEAYQIKWKSFWFTRQNFQRIECSSVKYKRGRLQFCNERSYRDLKRLEKILEDAKFLQPQSLKEKFTTNNRTKRCVPLDSRISPSVSGPLKSLHHAMDQGRTICFDVIISVTIFGRWKSAGGNMIGLNQ